MGSELINLGRTEANGTYPSIRNIEVTVNLYAKGLQKDVSQVVCYHIYYLE